MSCPYRKDSGRDQSRPYKYKGCRVTSGHAACRCKALSAFSVN